MSELLEISKRLTRAAHRWPLSEERRLDVLRVAKRIRKDGMDDQNIELLFISAAASGARYVDDYSEDTGLSKKEAVEILNRMWTAGTFEKGEESIHGTGRPRVIFTLAGEFPSMEKNSSEFPIDSLP